MNDLLCIIIIKQRNKNIWTNYVAFNCNGVKHGVGGWCGREGQETERDRGQRTEDKVLPEHEAVFQQTGLRQINLLYGYDHLLTSYFPNPFVLIFIHQSLAS